MYAGRPWWTQLTSPYPANPIQYEFMQYLRNSLVELITQTSTNLPPDVRAAMAVATATETPNT